MPENNQTNYVTENLYQGGYSSLSPEYGPLFTGYRASTSTIGVSTDPRTANILKEVSEKITPGQKVIELSLIDLGTPLDTITKQQLEEVKRLSKLTGVDITVHGPITDASGITEQGSFDEQQRQMAERKLINSMERANEVNRDGNVSVTFHTSNRLPGPTWNKTKEGEIIEMMPVVNQETGQLNVIKREEKYYPGREEKEIRTVQQGLDSINNTEWLNSLTNLENHKKEADLLLSKAMIPLAPILSGKKDLEKIEINENQKAAFNELQRAEIFLENIEASFNSLYDKTYKYSNDEDRKRLKRISENWIKGHNELRKEGNVINAPFIKSKILNDAISNIREISQTPQIYKPAEDYALDKTAETYGNVAFDSWEKFGKKAPIVNIENPPAGGGLSRGEDLKNVVEKSREQFVKKAMKERGMSKSVAEREAEKMIGVTWDVGHINQLRKFGFTGKDIIKEAEKIAPLLKHIHLSDNFGMDNIELPMGMGNVDLKEIMKKFGKKGEEAKKIIEAAHWWQFHQTSPVGPTLEALGSPIYGMNMAPYWNQTVGLQQGYLGGYGMMLPPINYETFGAGFSQLPAELGGQRPGGGGRMSNTPME